jgi:hypothetical protein
MRRLLLLPRVPPAMRTPAFRPETVAGWHAAERMAENA